MACGSTPQASAALQIPRTSWATRFASIFAVRPISACSFATSPGVTLASGRRPNAGLIRVSILRLSSRQERRWALA